MDYLALCVRLREEAGISGSGPTTVVDQTGQNKRIVNWISQAWQDIQIMRPNWLFMRSEFSFDTVIDERDNNPEDKSITDLKLWDIGSFVMYETALAGVEEGALPYLPYAEWRSRYRAQMSQRPSGRPQLFTITPDNYIRTEPKPDKIYTIEGEYKRTTQVFSADTDVPTNLDDDFHMLIVWQALKYYGLYENAPEVIDAAETYFDTLLYRLEIEQLPDMSEDREALA